MYKVELADNLTLVLHKTRQSCSKYGDFQTPGSNAQDIINNIKTYLKSAEKDFPDGIHYMFNFDTNNF
jgi:HAE1 family hydrophobic/amphiphilic exporter-1